MKKTILALSLVVSSSVWAFGSVVTDIKSYTYYVKQLEQGLESLELAEEKIKVATDTYDKVTSVDKRVSGNLQRAQQSLERIKELQDLSSADLEKSLRYAKNALKEIEDIPEYQKTIEDNVDDVFGKDNKDGWISVESEKQEHRQKAYKQALMDSELAQGKILLQYEQMEELAQATNSADSLKDATDVTNTILLEMLSNQREMINLLAAVTKNVSLAFYDGGDKSNKEMKIPDLTNNKDTTKGQKYISGCSPFDSGCKRKSVEEIMADIKKSEGK